MSMITPEVPTLVRLHKINGHIDNFTPKVTISVLLFLNQNNAKYEDSLTKLYIKNILLFYTFSGVVKYDKMMKVL